MADMHVRSDSVDVEQIMEQIRSRIREKRGVDYTEDQVRELASVRLEKFLDPKNLRSDLIEQFRRSRPAVNADVTSPYTFGEETIYETHRGPLRMMRRLLNPLLKLLFNPNPIIAALHEQGKFNERILREDAERRAAWNTLYYEVLHNLVIETTRAGIEVKNLRLRLEAMTSRLDFAERRVRVLEGVVQYRPEPVAVRERDDDDDRRPSGDTRGSVPSDGVTPSDARRRRRRRRGRRGPGGPFEGQPNAEGHAQGRLDAGPDAGGSEDAGDEGGDETPGQGSVEQ